jgi:hypothetical protein
MLLHIHAWLGKVVGHGQYEFGSHSGFDVEFDFICFGVLKNDT